MAKCKHCGRKVKTWDSGEGDRFLTCSGCGIYVDNCTCRPLGVKPLNTFGKAAEK